MSSLGTLPASSRDQVVAEIAREVVARLQAQLARGTEKAPARTAPRVEAPRPGHGLFATVDEAVALLLNTAAGERDDDGEFPAGSINHRVEWKLREWAVIATQLNQVTDSPE